ncbi:MAG: hypothetical protein H6Q73_2199 [Firmicutes bacterium]|nr:hypothetical protein [Bacillota bacterium]
MNNSLLKGIRVLDFTQFLAGPYCGMFLADMGADVIKVENLMTKGEFVRNAMPREKKTGRSMYFQNLNRNKRGVSLNLKSEEGKKIFAELIKSADVLIENMKPGVIGKLGFSYEVCKSLNPRIIFTSISGFGQYGEYSSRPGYDLIAQAMGGSMSITGWPGQEPTRAGMAIGDIMAGMNAAIGILASIIKRQETGKGQQIDIALVDTIVSGLEAKAMQYVYEGKAPEKTGFVIASGTDKHFVALSAAMGMPELASDPLYINTEARKKNADPLKAIINKWASDKTVLECVDIILGVEVPAGPIYTVKEVYEDKNIRETREMFVKVQHPEAGELTVMGNPIKMSEYPCEYKMAAPDLGQHNAEILKEIGFSEAEIAKFKDNGSIN